MIQRYRNQRSVNARLGVTTPRLQPISNVALPAVTVDAKTHRLTPEPQFLTPKPHSMNPKPHKVAAMEPQEDKLNPQ